MIAPLGAASVTMIVSLPSTSWSSMIVTGMVFVVSPGAKLSVPGCTLKSTPAPLAVPPVTPKLTVTGTLAARSRRTLSMVALPSSSTATSPMKATRTASGGAMSKRVSKSSSTLSISWSAR